MSPLSPSSSPSLLLLTSSESNLLFNHNENNLSSLKAEEEKEEVPPLSPPPPPPPPNHHQQLVTTSTSTRLMDQRRMLAIDFLSNISLSSLTPFSPTATTSAPSSSSSTSSFSPIPQASPSSPLPSCLLLPETRASSSSSCAEPFSNSLPTSLLTYELGPSHTERGLGLGPVDPSRAAPLHPAKPPSLGSVSSSSSLSTEDTSSLHSSKASVHSLTTAPPRGNSLPHIKEGLSHRKRSQSLLANSKQTTYSLSASAKHILSSRTWIVVQNSTPVSLVSCLAYNEEKRRMKREKMMSSQNYLEKWSRFDKRRKKSESYAHLLRSLVPNSSSYNPNYLDDPNLKTGKHKTVISLPCLMGSILHYTRPTDLKKELNERFREMHPEVDGSLTLSQIRNLKSKLIEIAMIMDMEISTVATAFVYFEKLVLKRIVEKANRRFVAAICVLLASKVNEPKGFPFHSFFQTLSKELGLSIKEIRDYEFYIFSQLEFHLYVPLKDIFPHFERIFSTLDYHNLQEYLGDSHFFFQM